MVGVPAPGDFAGAAAKVDQYRDEFDQDPGTWSPYTYDSLNFLAEGVETDAEGQLRVDEAWGKAVGAPY